MLFIPEDAPQMLEFHRIREMTAEHCMGEPGRQLADQIQPSTNARIIRIWLEEVDEWSRSLSGPSPIPFGQYEDIRPTFRYLQIVDSVLESGDLLRFRTLLRLQEDIREFLTEENQVAYPVMSGLIASLDWDSRPLQALQRVFDETGEVRDSASPELESIRRRMISLQKDLEKLFRQLVGQYRKSGWLTEAGESVRNGRLVLTVPVEHKRRIKGIIHDESASGKTVFLEPEQMVEANNNLFDLESEERREIHRILKELTAALRPYQKQFEALIQWTIRLDIIRAKALVSRMYKGHKPDIGDTMAIRLKEAFHPLLWLRNQPQGRKVIPFSLELGEKERILVVSGPNAGGKSITMKSVLLIQLLAQAGYLIPARPGSVLPVFQQVFADIGDQQSIEDDLSTYSSKLQNMRRFLEVANRRTLLAMDEFGSGTDPKMGGAIAEAILHELNRRHVFGVVTTHYSNLKIYAFHHEGLVNGSMIFNEEALEPTYELRVGTPGSSFAFEIAQSSGLPDRVLGYARKKSGQADQAVDQLLVDLQSDRRKLEDDLMEVRERKDRLDQLIRIYDQMFRDLEFQRKKHKMELREMALQQRSREQTDIDEVIRELKEEKNLDVAKQKRALLMAEQERLREQVGQIREEMAGLETGPEVIGGEVEVGSFVRIRNGGASGEVLRLDKGKAEVSVGPLKMIVDLKDLQAVTEPLTLRRKTSVSVDSADGDNPGNRLDIRGFKLADARRVVQLFLDKALLGTSNRVVILHGKGSGALRKMVVELAREYRDIRAVGPALPEEGGEGVTVITF